MIIFRIINFYFCISLVIFVLILLIMLLNVLASKKSATSTFDDLNEISDMIEELRDNGDDKLANIIENNINHIVSGNLMYMFFLLLFISFLPIINIFFLKSSIQTFIESLRG